MIADLLAHPDIQRTLHVLDPAQTMRWAMDIQQVPAPTFHEAERAALVAGLLRDCGVQDVQCDGLSNVYGRVPGGGKAHPLLVSAHLDTVFPAGTDLRLHRDDETGYVYGPGLGDNSLGVAGLLALASALRRAGVTPPGDLWLVANVCEEGIGDLRGMRAVIDRLGGTVAASIVLEGMAYGLVCTKGIGVRRYRVTVRCGGGHSWGNYGAPSAIHHLVTLGSALAALKLSARPRTTFNIGGIDGGTSINTIAARASMTLDLRSEDAGQLAALIGRMEQLAGEARQPGVEVALDVIGDRPFGQLPHGHPLTSLAIEVLAHTGVSEPRVQGSSTDANIPLSRGLDAICIGLAQGGNDHRVDEYVNPALLPDGLRQLALLVFGAFALYEM